MPRSKKQSVTLTDVAKKAGVSRTTAAKVLLGTGGDHVRIGDAASERVNKAATILNYRPNRAAQLLAGAKTQTLGVLMDTVNAPVMNDRLAAIEKEACARGYRLLIGQIHENNSVLSDYLSDFDSRGVDAILCLFDLTLGREKRLLPLLGDRNDIILHGKPLNKKGCCVRVNTAQAIDDIVKHLATIGYKRIGLQLEDMTDELMGVRRNAYIDAIQRSGQSLDQNLIWTAQSKPTIPQQQTLNTAIKHLVNQNDADAIIASNDVWGVRLVQSLKSQGFNVPEDVAVTGYDNLDFSTIIDPPLTTIDQQHDLYAKEAVNLLIKIASGTPPVTRTVTVPPRLVIRHSSQRDK